MTEYKRPELGDVKVGDQVIVDLGANKYRSDAERYIPAVVVNAARVWLDIESVERRKRFFPGGIETEMPSWRWRMRRDTQHEERVRHGWSGPHFRTPAQHDYDLVQAGAFRFLREQGISLDSSSPWRGREVDLAMYLKAWAARP